MYIAEGLGLGVAYKVIHVSSAEQEDCVVVRELGLVDVRAVGLNMCAVVNVVLGVHEADSGDPIPCLLSPVRVGLVASIPG